MRQNHLDDDGIDCIEQLLISYWYTHLTVEVVLFDPLRSDAEIVRKVVELILDRPKSVGQVGRQVESVRQHEARVRQGHLCGRECERR